MIKYSVETLYHFNCDDCGGYWSLSDSLPEIITCPHCSRKSSPIVQLWKAAIITEGIIRPEFTIEDSESV